ncbi:MAG: hypothetical protein U9R34_02615 [Nanoarchaeota archaeon]|nr:hypothetical protein [Nanoarchaeota archaeon]
MELNPVLLLKVASFISWVELPFWWLMLKVMKKNKPINKPINTRTEIRTEIRIRKTIDIMKKITAVSIMILSGIIVLEFLVINPEKISFIKSACLIGILIPLCLFLNIFEKIVEEMIKQRRKD